MLLLTEILLEIKKEDAALEFLSNLVKNGPFKNKVFLAGGSPRDMQMGLPPKDLDVVVKGDISAGIDFATWATKEIGNYKEGSNPVIFPSYGTAKFTLKGVIFKGVDLSDVDVEAVAPRKEKYTTGSRKPEVSGGELEDDVRRRDFTVNSLLHDLTTGEILDLTGMGKDDIKSGIVRTPLDPDIIFTEDPLRILRAVRFTAKYDWKLPMFMIRAIKQHAESLKNISKERIHDEVNKMILTKYPYKAFKLMQMMGVIQFVFPSLVEKNLRHVQETKNLPLDISFRLTSIFKDVPPSIVRSDLSNIRYDTTTIRNVVKMLEQLPSFLKMMDSPTDEELRRIGFNDRTIAKYLFSYCKFYLGMDVSKTEERFDGLVFEMDSNKIPVDGQDLISMGMKPGPNYKKILDMVRGMYLKNPLIPKDVYLDAIKSVIR